MKSRDADEKALGSGSQAQQQDAQDASDLAAMGHAQGLSRKFDMLSMLALAFCVLGTWPTFAQDLALGLMNGGPINMLWGLCFVTFCNVCVALSLGELCSSMPTTMGQAYWTYRLSGTRGARFASYCCAWINTFGWWTLTASQIGFMTQFLFGIKVVWDPVWGGASEGWTQFLLFIGITACLTLFNCLACRHDSFLPRFNTLICIWFIALFIVICLVLLISVGTHSDLEFQSPGFVFGTWINETGWNDATTWFIGLLEAAYGLTAFDSVVHMVEEIPAPRVNAPKVITLSVLFGALSGFVFIVICLFCVQSLNDLLSANIPFMTLLQEGISLTGATVLLALFIPFGLGAGISTMTTTSRLTWAFARDGGLPYSEYFTYVDPKWKAPVRAIILQGFIVAIPGVLYFASDLVLESILSVSTIALTVSYAIPIATLLWVGRSKLPPGGMSLGRLGPVMNWIGIIYCIITTIFFFFPEEPDPPADYMNYGVAIMAVMLFIAGGFWFFKGKKSYLSGDDAEERMREARRLENEEEREEVGSDSATVVGGGEEKHEVGSDSATVVERSVAEEVR